MALIDITLPSLGEGITDATILKWHKNTGDRIAEDETLVDIATDKVDSEVPSTVSGILKEKLCDENQVVTVGSIIARIETEEESIKGETITEDTAAGNETMEVETQVPYQPESTHDTIALTEVNPDAADAPNNGFYSPLVLNIARAEGITFSELEKIMGTGNDGRLSKDDILAYLEQQKAGDTPPPTTVSPVQPENITTTLPSVSVPDTPQLEWKTTSSAEIMEMDRMRKLIASNMKESQNQTATVTSFEEADVTAIVQWRNNVKDRFEANENTKLTYTPIFFDCIIRVLKGFPLLNSSIEGDNIILKKDINIGMATALPNGNLIVPVIQNAAYLNLAGLAREINLLANKARQNRLKPVDTQGGTFTITNVGGFGSLIGTPIINIPEVAILALGSIKKKPVVIETPNGDTIGIRHIMMLALSYDHRIIDGALGSTFLHEIVKEMEAWDPKKSI